MSSWLAGRGEEKKKSKAFFPPSPFPTYSMFCTDIVVPTFLESSKEKSL